MAEWKVRLVAGFLDRSGDILVGRTNSNKGIVAMETAGAHGAFHRRALDPAPDGPNQCVFPVSHWGYPLEYVRDSGVDIAEIPAGQGICVQLTLVWASSNTLSFEERRQAAQSDRLSWRFRFVGTFEFAS